MKQMERVTTPSLFGEESAEDAVHRLLEPHQSLLVMAWEVVASAALR